MSAPRAVRESEIVVRPGRAKDTRVRSLRRRAYKALVGLLGVAAGWLLRGLPVAAAVAVGRAAGSLTWLFSRGNRALALETLAIAFPEKSAGERAAIAKESFARLGAVALEWAAWPAGDHLLDRVVRVEGRENADEALARGKGVLWITGHIGNWELMAARISSAGYRCSVVATTVRYAAINRFSIALRGSHGVGTIERESASAGRELLRLLRGNGNLGILLDHDSHVPSMQVDFFGRPAWTAIGAAELAVKLGCAAVPSFIVREGDGHVVKIGAAIFPPKVAKADQPQAIRDLTQAYTRVIEDHVRAHPEDWAWMHRRWRT